MKKELLNYLAGLCQAASAALIASAIIVPDAREASLIGTLYFTIVGGVLIALKEKA